MITTEQIAWDFYHSGEAFNSQTLIDRYGFDMVRACQVIIQLDKAAKYTCEIAREGRLVKSVRVLNVRGKDPVYLKIRDTMEASGEEFTPSDLVKRFGVNRGTAGNILYKLRKDPHINTETVQKGKALAVRIKTEPLSTESKLWWVLTTKPWSHLRAA